MDWLAQTRPAEQGCEDRRSTYDNQSMGNTGVGQGTDETDRTPRKKKRYEYTLSANLSGDRERFTAILQKHHRIDANGQEATPPDKQSPMIKGQQSNDQRVRRECQNRPQRK